LLLKIFAPRNAAAEKGLKLAFCITTHRSFASSSS
jgi:hypothetical protein